MRNFFLTESFSSAPQNFLLQTEFVKLKLKVKILLLTLVVVVFPDQFKLTIYVYLLSVYNLSNAVMFGYDFLKVTMVSFNVICF